jgi:hypothetical protein
MLPFASAAKTVLRAQGKNLSWNRVDLAPHYIAALRYETIAISLKLRNFAFVLTLSCCFDKTFKEFGNLLLIFLGLMDRIVWPRGL